MSGVKFVCRHGVSAAWVDFKPLPPRAYGFALLDGIFAPGVVGYSMPDAQTIFLAALGYSADADYCIEGASE